MELSLENKIEAAVTLLRQVSAQYASVAFANSLGAEDMVLLDLLEQHQIPAEQFTLDTGRLPEETHQLMKKIQDRYSRPLHVYFPDSLAVEALLAQQGSNGFYDSVENRKSCCHVRKVQSLQRALKGKGAWITGLRREQAVTRADLQAVEADRDNGLIKVSPLLDWSTAEVWSYLKSRQVPWNALHDQFYPSIGCAPCTRSITVGEDIRAGRWWWENDDSKECGLHSRKD